MRTFVWISLLIRKEFSIAKMRLCWTNVILTVREAKLMLDSVICEYYVRLHLTSDL